ncbi:MAG: DUF169 domain-containing protein [Bacillota bacterium]
MKQNFDYSELIARINSVLELKRNIVGVKFIFNKEEFEKYGGADSKKKRSYCRMVKEAAEGQEITADFDNFSCFAGARALGIVELDEAYKSGAYYDGCGLYQDSATARAATDAIEICEHDLYGVQVKPLKDFKQRPDIIIIITNSFNAMRLIQAYSHQYGPYKEFKMLGNQAICSECTAQPYKNDNISFSLLCAGARKSGFKQEEVGLGIKSEKFEAIVAGLCATVTPVENNQNKKLIAKKLQINKIKDVELTYNKNYGDQLRHYDLDLFLR